MISKLFGFLYHKIFVNIIVEDTKSRVHVEVCNNKGTIIDETDRTFSTTTLTQEMHDFIDSYVKESPYSYVSFLDFSASQGALPTCSQKSMSTYYDISASKYLCYKDKWAYYTSESDLNSLQKVYKKLGVDFIFSPFPILANFFKDKINTSSAMFILIEEKTVSLMVFNNSELLYADYINIENQKDFDELSIDDTLEEDEDIDFGDDIDLDEIDVIDEMSSLDDLGDIEDLDTFDEIEEFSDVKEIDYEIKEESNKEDLIDTEEGFNEDYQRFSFVQGSINHFYKDSKYKSNFIESVYIADDVNISGDLKRYLEEEMFLSVYIRQIDLAVEVCEMAKAELK